MLAWTLDISSRSVRILRTSIKTSWMKMQCQHLLIRWWATMRSSLRLGGRHEKVWRWFYFENGVVTIDDKVGEKAMNDLTLSGDLHHVNKRMYLNLILINWTITSLPYHARILYDNDDSISSGMVFTKLMGIRHVRGWKWDLRSKDIRGWLRFLIPTTLIHYNIILKGEAIIHEQHFTTQQLSTYNVDWNN